jgi:hypothetical protein
MKIENTLQQPQPKLETELAQDELFGESGYYVRTKLKVGPDYGTFNANEGVCVERDSKGNCTKTM